MPLHVEVKVGLVSKRLGAQLAEEDRLRMLAVEFNRTIQFNGIIEEFGVNFDVFEST